MSEFIIMSILRQRIWMFLGCFDTFCTLLFELLFCLHKVHSLNFRCLIVGWTFTTDFKNKNLLCHCKILRKADPVTLIPLTFHCAPFIFLHPLKMNFHVTFNFRASLIILGVLLMKDMDNDGKKETKLELYSLLGSL